MKLTKGENLTPEQIKMVKSCYLYRWTFENEYNAFHHGFCPSKAFLIDDEQWIKEHAFYFRKDGKLSQRHQHCVPAYEAD